LPSEEDERDRIKSKGGRINPTFESDPEPILKSKTQKINEKENPVDK